MTGIDRDALNELNRATTALALELPGPVYDDYRRRLDVFLASVQPATGITLTPGEARMLATAARHEARWNHEHANPEERMGGEVVYYEAERRYLDLAARLEGSA